MEKTPIGGASREPLLTGNPRGPGLREAAVRAALGSGHTGERELYCVFSTDFKNAYRKERCQKNHRRSASNKLAPT